ncbi:MAG TPA: M20/M25/M40 family metallo-hydrolase [Acidobacteriota bacterium]|nr:M20/M25/M40 family metallo-hydrolase [Acidobacteriota bacterium]
MLIDRDFTLETLQSLVRIDSRNPGLQEGAPGEAALARFVSRRLEEMGWETESQQLGEERCNVVARRRGTADGPSLMLNVHLDTVGVEGMKDPFSGDLRGGRVWGRGAQDSKGGMAAVLGAAKAVSESGVELKGDLVLAFVADEEHESIGTERLMEEVKTDAAIVLEPTDLDVCIAHRGFALFKVGTRGRTAHGGQSDIGIDANMHMGLLLAELERLKHEWEREHRHPMLGSASLHVPLISGGKQPFIYSGHCAAQVECRTVPGQTVDGVTAELRQTLEALGKRVEGFQGSLELLQWRAPFQTDPERLIVQTVWAEAEAVRGEAPRIIAHPWWEDSGLLAAAGIETVVIGPKGEGLHSESEWVDADSVVDLARILHRSVLSYCGDSLCAPGR